jgi:hypothetical protein
VLSEAMTVPVPKGVLAELLGLRLNGHGPIAKGESEFKMLTAVRVAAVNES